VDLINTDWLDCLPVCDLFVESLVSDMSDVCIVSSGVYVGSRAALHDLI